MKCKTCNNENKRMEIVKDYFQAWKWWFLSVIACLVLVSFSNFVLVSTLTDFSMPILISLAIMYVSLFFIPIFCFFKVGPGLLSMSAMLMFVMSITTPDALLDSFMKVLITSSLLLFSIDVLLGVKFTFYVRVKERSWSFQERTK